MRMRYHAALGIMCLLAMAVPAVQASAGNAESGGQDFLQAREFSVEHVQSAAATMEGEQTVRCWQVAGGSWNGQSLAGLSMVMVEPTRPAMNAGPVSMLLYVNDFATPAQRDALVAAIMAVRPTLFVNHETAPAHVEPALIRVEQAGPGTLVLHLALIA